MSIDTYELIRQLYVAGAELSLTGTDTVRITGHSVPKSLIEPLREQKQEIIRILEEQGVGRNEDGLNSPLPRRYVVPPACLSNRVCARLGPCSQHLMRHGCVRVRENGPNGAAPSRATGPASHTAENSTRHHQSMKLQHAGS